VTYAEWKRDDAECRASAANLGERAEQQLAYVTCMRQRGYRTGRD